ncbi:MAG: AtuA-related protein [Bacillota bacterium]
MRTVKLRELAFSCSGDKGNISNVGVIPFDEKNYELLCEQLTIEKVKDHFGDLIQGQVIRYEVPGVRGLNFVMHDALQGGVSRSLNLDLHGKNRRRLILDMDIDVE